MMYKINSAFRLLTLVALIERGPFEMAAQAHATTYYVDVVSGNDSNNGTSTSTPWRTIAHVNSWAFNPGDSILFRAGDIWREQLNIKHSGSEGSPITFGSYEISAQRGRGNRASPDDAPIISGADLGTGWASTTTISPPNSSSSVTLWSISEATSTNQVFEDGTRLVSSPASNTMSAGSFYYDNGEEKLYVRTFSDDSPNAHTMEISTRKYAIDEAGGQSYVTLEGLEVADSNDDNIYFNGSTDITISNVSSINAFSEGIRFDVVSKSTILSSTAAYSGANGFSVDDAPNLVVTACVAHDNAMLANLNYTAGIKVNPNFAPYASSTGVVIEYSQSFSNGIGMSGWRGSGIWIDTAGPDSVIRFNTTYGNNLGGIRIDADDYAAVYANVSYSNLDGGILLYADGQTSMSGNLLYNNTVYGNQGVGISISGPSSGSSPGGCMHNAAINNISVKTIGGPNFQALRGCENPGADGSGNIYTYNAFGAQAANFIRWGSSSAYYSSYSSWENAKGNCGSTDCSRSVQSDPLFVSPLTDNFALLPTSPVIGAGLNLGTNYEYGLDPRPSRPSSTSLRIGYWDLGAYVYTGISTPLISLSTPSSETRAFFD